VDKNKKESCLIFWLSLVHLDVGNNKLTLLPAELINLVNLKLLSIRDNAGLRELPPFGNYKCLESLRMRNVGKVSALPPDLFTLKSLTELDLRENPQFVELPSQIGELTNLELLDLYGNGFKARGRKRKVEKKIVKCVPTQTIPATIEDSLVCVCSIFAQCLVEREHSRRSSPDAKLSRRFFPQKDFFFVLKRLQRFCCLRTY
jgi:hypothetical protein